MSLAFDQACSAARVGEVPVGAVLVNAQGAILAQGHNQTIGLHDPTAHAEILCLRRAAQERGNYRLPGSILVVTLEPCIMCVGALVHARVAGIVFASSDPKAGALVSNLQASALPFLNHHPWSIGGVLDEECSSLLKRFFLSRRKSKS